MGVLDFLKSKDGQILIIASYTIALIAIFVIISILTYLNYINPNDNELRKLIFIACSGGLGALSFSLYSFIYHTSPADPKDLNKEPFKTEYIYSYILRPFLGILFGVFIYFFIVGGLMVISTEPKAGTITIFFIALAFLAGYAEEPFALQLKKLAESLFKDPKEKK